MTSAPRVLVVTPVKDSLETALETARSIAASSTALEHTVFDDFSGQETRMALAEGAGQHGYRLVHLEELTDAPSPNYDVVLRTAREEAVRRGLPLAIVESDVEVEPDTLERLLDFHDRHPDAGMVAAVTTDEGGAVNYPYEKFRRAGAAPRRTRRSVSFCCTLLSPRLLQRLDFDALDPAKDWYDVSISRSSIEMGYANYILPDTPVVHRPHSSRPWKQLKYRNPLRYYLNKLRSGKDRI